MANNTIIEIVDYKTRACLGWIHHDELNEYCDDNNYLPHHKVIKTGCIRYILIKK